ncbi:DUF7133 domain-containing protein [Persicirhabdus sediminis]|uniref:C-type cytochrome n=1 Tax=Persicirhabdus sediminis TaxID=454144 RepID=A0A8J7MEC6_9BACT|nr:c-type cytochrome [Persicirhabdus sediminis]MBK1790978.1 c-type cytochrome [Persicirhabdus sediminis]
MLATTLTVTIKRVSLVLLSSSLLAIGQQGDRQNPAEQLDPISADKIPPAPHLDLAEAMKSFQVADGFVVEPVISNPLLDKPIAMAIDANGRVWVVEMRSYMPDLDGNGEDRANGRISILEDSTGDGNYDKQTVFLDDLVLPRAVALAYGGVLYTSGDSLYFIERNGLEPVGSAVLIDEDYAKGGNPEHKANGLIYGHDNWFYSAKSGNRYRRIDGSWKKEPTKFRGQFGISKDNDGRLYYNSNSTLMAADFYIPQFFKGNSNYQPAKLADGARIGGKNLYPIRMNPGINRAYQGKLLDDEGKMHSPTAASGVAYYRGENFPAEYSQLAVSGEPAANVVKAFKVNFPAYNKVLANDAFDGREILASTDERFRPVNVYTGPDGTLWVVDMYFGLLQHKVYMTSYLRKQYASRKLDQDNDNTGRIYRLRWAENPASEVPKLEGLSNLKIFNYLAHPNGVWRDIAQRLLVESGDLMIVPLLNKLVDQGRSSEAKIHALWTLDGLNAVNSAAIKSALNDSDERVRMTGFELAPKCDASELAEVSAMLIEANDSYKLYRARSLARIGSSESWLELAKVLVDGEGNDALNAAALSGIGGRLNEYLEFTVKHQLTNNDRFDEYVAEAIKQSQSSNKPAAVNLRAKALASFERGKEIYQGKAACLGCHGMDGAGLPNLGPPLAASDWVTGSKERLVKVLLRGLQGPIVVSGEKYAPALSMPGLAANPTISDQDLADVMTYIRNAWGNQSSAISSGFVSEWREKTESRGEQLYTADDFK